MTRNVRCQVDRPCLLDRNEIQSSGWRQTLTIGASPNEGRGHLLIYLSSRYHRCAQMVSELNGSHRIHFRTRGSDGARCKHWCWVYHAGAPAWQLRKSSHNSRGGLESGDGHGTGWTLPADQLIDSPRSAHRIGVVIDLTNTPLLTR